MNYFESSEELFQERYNEVNYFLQTAMRWKDSQKNDDQSAIILSREHEHILKSNIILMQYNVIEAVFVELFASLYDYLSRYDSLLDNMDNNLTYQIFRMIRRLPNDAQDKFQRKVSQDSTLKFSSIILSLCFELTEDAKRKLINGNLDGKKIKHFFTEFGIDIEPLDEIKLTNIYEIKNQRQLLAHGGLSFSNVGKDISWDGLEENNAIIQSLFDTSKNLLTLFITNLISANSPNVESNSYQ